MGCQTLDVSSSRERTVLRVRAVVQSKATTTLKWEAAEPCIFNAFLQGGKGVAEINYRISINENCDCKRPGYLVREVDWQRKRQL